MGATTNAAFVSFTTSDDTAKAGEDYAPLSGMRDFAPLEVSKEVVVPLLAKTAIEDRRSFKLELSNASPGCATIAATPVVILPDLRMAVDSLRPRADGSITLTLHGTLPGLTYCLETSTNLTDWFGWASADAANPSTRFGPFSSDRFPRFFRARR